MLQVRDLTAGYGSGDVLHGLALDLGPGEVLGLLGRNGAGKTTALKAVMGLVRVSGGSVALDGVDLAGLPAHEIPKRGLGYVPQGRRLFAELTVRENLEIGLAVKPSGREVLERALALFPVLTERLGQRSGSLSGGEQQMLAVARALCLEPRLLLMDEPTEGLMPSMVAKIRDTVSALKAEGVAVIFVEQKVEAALAVADRVAFLENGRIAATASPEALHADPAPLERYVGVGLADMPSPSP